MPRWCSRSNTPPSRGGDADASTGLMTALTSRRPFPVRKSTARCWRPLGYARRRWRRLPGFRRASVGKGPLPLFAQGPTLRLGRAHMRSSTHPGLRGQCRPALRAIHPIRRLPGTTPGENVSRHTGRRGCCRFSPAVQTHPATLREGSPLRNRFEGPPTLPTRRVA
jgi:hypothetical protein